MDNFVQLILARITLYLRAWNGQFCPVNSGQNYVIFAANFVQLIPAGITLYTRTWNGQFCLINSGQNYIIFVGVKWTINSGQNYIMFVGVKWTILSKSILANQIPWSDPSMDSFLAEVLCINLQLINYVDHLDWVGGTAAKPFAFVSPQ